jgi:hypothetical protein
MGLLEQRKVSTPSSWEHGTTRVFAFWVGKAAGLICDNGLLLLPYASDAIATVYGVVEGGVASFFKSSVRATSAWSKLWSWVFWRKATSIDSVSAQSV